MPYRRVLQLYNIFDYCNQVLEFSLRTSVLNTRKRVEHALELEEAPFEIQKIHGWSQWDKSINIYIKVGYFFLRGHQLVVPLISLRIA